MLKKTCTVSIILLAIILRFYELGNKPLWMDEALYYSFVTNGSNQEFVPIVITKTLSNFVGIHNEFWLRFPFAFVGVLCIVGIFLVKGTSKYSLILALFFAIFPLFVFWSRMARPYIFGSLFIILGYRWWYFYILGILTTPLSILGLNLVKAKQKIIPYILLIIFAVSIFFIRPDTDRGFNLEFFYHAKRIWVLPFTIILLYLDDVYKYFIIKWK